ncbi:MAG: HAMP domain-containing protein [Deltaproteobacteria bacterium]|nr:MAG: HAMP domain-containing protein [Deltaproteobacteria bacterium]
MRQIHLSLSTKLLAGVGLVLVMLLSVDVWSLYRLRKIGDQLRLLKRGYLPLTKLASHLDAWQFNKRPDTQRLLQTPPSRWTVSLVRRLRYEGGLLKRSMGNVQRWVEQGSAYEKATLKQLTKALKDLNLLFVRYHGELDRLARVANPKTKGSLSANWRAIFLELDRLLRRSIRQLGQQMDARLAQVVVQAERTERRSTLTLVLLSLMALLVSSVVLILSRRSLARVSALVEWTRRIAAGDYQHNIKITSKDEIGVLADAFHRMAQALEERERHLAQKREELEEAYHELQISSERLLRSERLAAIGQLAAQITHEIRNPLNAIGLNLELLEEDIQQLPNAAEGIAVLQATLDEVERLTLITEEYLRFARLPPPRLESADINPILSDTMEFLSSELLERNIDWELELAPSLPLINVDVQQLRQALLNLLRNAMQAAASDTGRDGELFVSTQLLENGVEIVIRDNGPGIPQEIQEEIFDPFYSTKEEGTGLGLPLTQQIIVGHGGSIVCDSENGLGTSFVMVFPMAAETRKEMEEREAEE